jgi:flagellar hook assembly protein FlgD
MWWMVEVREGNAGREVYTGDPQKPPGVPSTLGAGESATWTWNTKDNEGNWQPAGRYRIRVYINMPQVGFEATRFSDGFNLTAAAERLEITVTSNRKKYNSGDVVTFTIRNTGTRALDTSRFTWIVYRLYSSGPVARSTHNSRPSGVPDPLDVGESASWSWDGRNDSGGFVNPDNYELEVKLLDEGIEGNCFFRVQ